MERSKFRRREHSAVKRQRNGTADFADFADRKDLLRVFAVFGGMKSDFWSVIIGFANPNGIESSSPGLRGTSYPG
jgi:hypothetical protein